MISFKKKKHGFAGNALVHPLKRKIRHVLDGNEPEIEFGEKLIPLMKGKVGKGFIHLFRISDGVFKSQERTLGKSQKRRRTDDVVFNEDASMRGNQGNCFPKLLSD